MSEALEAGCIPILDDGFKHFGNAWPGVYDHAVVTTEAWDAVAGASPSEALHKHISRLLLDRAALDVRQRGMMAWYNEHKAAQARGVGDAVGTALSVAGNLLLRPTPPSPQDPAARGGLDSCASGAADSPHCKSRLKLRRYVCDHQGALGKGFRKRCPVMCGTCEV